MPKMANFVVVALRAANPACLHLTPGNQRLCMGGTEMHTETHDTRPACVLTAPGDLRLLRLMARMEPAWQALAPGTAAALLRCLAKMVAERTALPRVLPWLWPLATPEACPLMLY